MKHAPKVGMFVRSHFRACWTGVVIDVELRKDYEPLITCVIVRDRRGNLLKARRTRRLSLLWTTPCAPIDVSMYPTNWFANPGATS